MEVWSKCKDNSSGSWGKKKQKTKNKKQKTENKKKTIDHICCTKAISLH